MGATPSAATTFHRPPVAQPAEAVDLKSTKLWFDPTAGDQIRREDVVILAFTIKKGMDSKCDACVHAHILRPKNNVENAKVTICTLLGAPMGPIKECNRFTPPHLAPIPAHLVAGAWIIDRKRLEQAGRAAGFVPPAEKPNPFTDMREEPRQLQPLMVEAPADAEIVEDIESEEEDDE